MPRFVLLLHDCPDANPRPTHCDLMFETGDSLATWALPQLPHDWQGLIDEPQLNLASTNTVEVERLADHRKAYLDYEGPVSDGRGSVRRLDAGMYTMTDGSNEYVIEGEILRGTIQLQPPNEKDRPWQLTFIPARMP